MTVLYDQHNGTATFSVLYYSIECESRLETLDGKTYIANYAQTRRSLILAMAYIGGGSLSIYNLYAPALAVTYTNPGRN